MARFQAAPKESHVLAMKRIFRYLKGTKEFGLWYPKGKDLSLIAYVEADWAGVGHYNFLINFKQPSET